jgi:hypothetical protein
VPTTPIHVLPAGSHAEQHHASSTGANQDADLHQAYSQATSLIKQATEAVSNLGLSADAEEGFKR